MRRRFRQVDVFGSGPLLGNPVCVVIDADDLGTEAMQAFARWTNLSETTFLLPPTDAGADYRVRIFTPDRELPFAGHPTLGSCHAWLASGGSPADPGAIVQECGAGLVPVRRETDGTFAFAAPPLVRSGPVDAETLDAAIAVAGLRPEDVADAAWADNGPSWLALLLHDVERLRTLKPAARGRLDVGVVAACGPGEETAFEIRAFFPIGEQIHEDPVTGSLNASVAQWLIGTGRAQPPYLVGQGGAMGRAGRIAISLDDGGAVWVGGAAVTVLEGAAEL